MRRLISLSVAHTENKQGASYWGFSEYYESIIWTNLLSKQLRSKGYPVFHVPSNTHLRHKVARINGLPERSQLAIEIHFNGSINPMVAGCETLYCPGSTQGKILANHVQERLSLEMGNRDRGVKEGWYKMQKSRGPDFFLAKTDCPAIIIEPDFIAQIKNIISKREKACEAIAFGIAEYLR